MFKTYTLLPILGILCLLLACGDSESAAEQDTTSTSTEQTAPAAEPLYPSISIDRLEYLWNNSTYMDVVFYELPASLNQSSLEQIRSTLAGIGDNPPTINPNCQSIGRIFFQVGGENVEQAEIYFNNGCTYYVWLEDGQAAYANEMTSSAIGFYNNIFQQLSQSSGQQGQ